MKKILIFGCSFTVGSYIQRDHINFRNPIGQDELKNNKSWWHYVDYFKDSSVNIVACPGQGYWSWYQLLLFLEADNNLNYDEIWIQETFEPRPTVINNYYPIYKLFNKFHPEIEDNVKLLIIPKTTMQTLIDAVRMTAPFPILEENPHYSTTFKIEFFRNIVKSCAEYIKKICINNNIKGYVWSMSDFTMECDLLDCTMFNRLPIKSVQPMLLNKGLLTSEHTGAHQTEEGSKYIGELINKACIDMKI
jgi:hypothetical protein